MDTMVIDLLGHTADAVAALPEASAEWTPKELREALVTLQAHLDAVKVAQSRLLVMGDRRKVWVGTGARDMADWLAAQTTCAVGDARRKVRLGEVLDASAGVASAVARGVISPDVAEALHSAVCDVPEGADLSSLIEAVEGVSPKQARDAADRWLQIHRPDDPAAVADRRSRRRSVRFGQPVDGMVDTRVTLPVLESAQFRASLTAIGGKPTEGDERTTEQRLADGLVQLCAAHASGDLAGGREGANLIITMSADAFAGLTNEPATTANGDQIPAHVARQLAENAVIQRIVTDGNRILDLGRTHRWVSHDQYKALVVRDGGCRWPGCHIPAAWCDADHLVAWEDGGTTDLDNLWLLCRHHHTEKHRPGVVVTGTVDAATIRLTNGRTITATRRRSRTGAAA